MDAILLSAKIREDEISNRKNYCLFDICDCCCSSGAFTMRSSHITVFGTEGWNLPIQVLDAKILYNWTLLKTIGIRIFMSF